jgi:hypothetical protein
MYTKGSGSLFCAPIILLTVVFKINTALVSWKRTKGKYNYSSPLFISLTGYLLFLLTLCKASLCFLNQVFLLIAYAHSPSVGSCVSHTARSPSKM